MLVSPIIFWLWVAGSAGLLSWAAGATFLLLVVAGEQSDLDDAIRRLGGEVSGLKNERRLEQARKSVIETLAS